MRQISDITNIIPSAIGTAIHIPITPKIRGSTMMPEASRTKVLRKDRAADTLPFDSAVNMADVKMLVPQNRKLNEKIANPLVAMSYTTVAFSTKS